LRESGSACGGLKKQQGETSLAEFPLVGIVMRLQQCVSLSDVHIFS
jgi:hypothetical protein